MVDVPARLAARVRVFDTGDARKTDAIDAHAKAAVALRTPDLRVLSFDEGLVAMRLFADRRDELSARRVQTVNRLHRLLTATKAKRLLATVKPRTLLGRTTRRMAAEEILPMCRRREPRRGSWRPMSMTVRRPVAFGVLVLSWFVGGCDSDRQGMPSCSLTATITFDGREYIAVDSLPGLKRREVSVGERRGFGERATCPGQAVRQVEVYKVVGVPVGQGVFSKPEFGVMERWNQDGAIK